MSKIIYLASPFFTVEERNRVVDLAEELRDSGHTVYVPMEHEVNDAWGLENHVWAETVFLEDMKAIRDCEEVYAIINGGMTDDAGTCWEIGFAFGIGKPVTLVMTNREKQSLMIQNGSSRARDFKTLDIVSKKEFEQS